MRNGFSFSVVDCDYLIDFNDHTHFHKHGSKERKYNDDTVLLRLAHLQDNSHLKTTTNISFELFFVVSVKWVETRRMFWNRPKVPRWAAQKKCQVVDEAMRQTTLMTSTSIICRVLINISSFLMTYFSSSHPSRVKIGLLHPNVYSFSK